MKPQGKFLTPEGRLQLKRAMSYTERFDLLMRLIRISKMMQNAKILPPKE